MSDLSGKAVRGGAWAAAEQVVSQGLRLGRYAVLARLLTPAQFGLFGFAVIALTITNRFSELGLDTALVAREGDIEETLPTAYTLQVARGLVLGGVLYLLAPLVAAVFGAPEVTGLVRLVALIPVVDGLHNPGLVHLDRALDFRTRALITIVCDLGNTITAVWLAFSTESVVALVAGMIVGTALRAVLSFVAVSTRPLPGFDLAEARRLVDYGKWLTGTSILAWLTREGDDALVGILLGSASLGFYRTAYQFGRSPQSEITGVVNRVAFPTYATVQSDLGALRVGYRRTLQLVGVLAFPASVGLALVAPVFIPVVLGPGWAEAVPVMQVLSLTTVFHTVGATSVSLFEALNRPDLHTKIQVGVLVVLGVTILPLVDQLGLVGAAFAVMCSVAFAAPLRAVLASRLLESSLIEQVSPLAPAAVATAGMAAVVAPLVPMAPPSALGLVALVATGVVAYVLATLALELLGAGTVDLAREMVTAVRG